ncbi:DUF7667 family protein [Paenibacillus monticola]|uniref:Uncharacterized protein n=1 Tax=Paenibacillus monticola TaxID=2666075 RepID=A0A7X2L0D2_9BACL|nr:hypothetical protein [Paenibacillus monticola]MRN52013.1 hypothetical protein [Paenibacillus monticola]
MDCNRGSSDCFGDRAIQNTGAALMLPVHLRLAEFFHMHKAGKLTHAHGPELLQCLQVNAQYCWDVVKLEQLSGIAILLNDDTWFDELRIRIDALRLTGRAPKL